MYHTQIIEFVYIVKDEVINLLRILQLFTFVPMHPHLQYRI